MAKLTSSLIVSIIFGLAAVSRITERKVFTFEAFTFYFCHESERFPNLIDATLDDLQHGLEDGLFTSVDLTRTYIARIAEVNDHVHAVTEVNPDALDIAAMLDSERAQGVLRGPLHGIPILIKDTIATADKMNNTAGSLILLGAKVPRDATVAHKLRQAGAILLGKASLTQWSNMRSNNSTSGWSAYGGQTLGAYHPRQEPHGSSGGSAVAVDLGLAAVTIGTETDGSITMPAHRSSVVGIKPTVGLVSRDLVIPISERQDSVGPMAKTVREAAQALQAIAGHDPRDNYTEAIPPGRPDYVAACKSGSIRGARIGIPWNAIELKMAAERGLEFELEAFKQQVALLQDAGATIVDANFTMAKETLESDGQDVVLNADFVVNLASYLSQLSWNPNNLQSLYDVRDLTRRYPEEGIYDTSVWDQALEGQSWNNTDPRFWPVYQRNLYLTGEGGLLGALERHNLDSVIMPTSMSKRWASMSGAPIVTVPMCFHPADAEVVVGNGGLVRTGPGMPFGIAFMGRKWSEEKLIGLAYAFGQRTRVRGSVRPQIKPWTEINVTDQRDSEL